MARSVIDKMEVTFVTKNGEMMIRFTRNTFDGVIESARTLNAEYFVVQDSWDHKGNQPVWAVYKTASAHKEPGMGWVLPLPVRNFYTETTDAPVMWALNRLGS